jgi:Ca-activated chloride channel family protein
VVRSCIRSANIRIARVGSLLRPLSVLSVLFVLFTLPAYAQGWIEMERPIDPALPREIERVGSEVRISVNDRVARVEVEERFRNMGGRLAEGTYLYPMPGEAVFTNFSLWMGDQEVRGETMNAEQARSIYEDIVRRRKDPALLTFAGHGLIRAQVFPIQPGETRKVVLRYTQLLTRSGDAVRLRYALGNRGPAGGTGFRVTLDHPASYGTPYSPTHSVETRRAGDRLEVTIPVASTGDVELFLPLLKGLAGASLLTHAPGGEDGYFMLLLAPSQAETGTSLPRDVTLVVDVSGSMSGTKLEQAKAALQQALGTLSPRDRFRLITFSSAVRRFRDDFAPATRENLTAAREYIDRLSAEGGTNIAGALEAALEPRNGPERLGLVLFVTDGLPSIGEQAPDRIAEQAAARRSAETRIFTVGIGHDVNTYLLDRLATSGRGSAEYVAPGSSVETAIGSLLAKLRYPAMVNLQIGETPVSLSQSYPAQLPDLFYGEELVVFGRYRGQGSGNIVITGERNGRRERLVVPAAFNAGEPENDFIPRLWAARQIGDLTRQIRLEGATPGLIDQVRQLGLRYGILTEYTSYLVQEPTDLVGPAAPVPLREDQMGGARNSPTQTGRQAFERAQASSKLSDSKSLAAAEDAIAAGAGSLPSPASGVPTSRRIAGRLFVQRGRVWTDLAHADRITVTAIAAYSKAYFEMVRLLPEVAPYLSVGDEIVIAGRRASIRVGAEGIEVWRPGQLGDLVRNFRGT